MWPNQVEAEERKKKVIEYLKNGSFTVLQLSKIYGVAETTMRRYVYQMRCDGLPVRIAKTTIEGTATRIYYTFGSESDSVVRTTEVNPDAISIANLKEYKFHNFHNHFDEWLFDARKAS